LGGKRNLWAEQTSPHLSEQTEIVLKSSHPLWPFDGQDSWRADVYLEKNLVAELRNPAAIGAENGKQKSHTQVDGESTKAD
jgi:hypothetical protein